MSKTLSVNLAWAFALKPRLHLQKTTSVTTSGDSPRLNHAIHRIELRPGKVQSCHGGDQTWLLGCSGSFESTSSRRRYRQMPENSWLRDYGNWQRRIRNPSPTRKRPPRLASDIVSHHEL